MMRSGVHTSARRQPPGLAQFIGALRSIHGIVQLSICIRVRVCDATIYTHRQPTGQRLRFLLIPRGVERRMDRWLLAAVSIKVQSGIKVNVARCRLCSHVRTWMLSSTDEEPPKIQHLVSSPLTLSDATFTPLYIYRQVLQYCLPETNMRTTRFPPWVSSDHRVYNRPCRCPESCQAASFRAIPIGCPAA
jgi:hypothetical protein